MIKLVVFDSAPRLLVQKILQKQKTNNHSIKVFASLAWKDIVEQHECVGSFFETENQAKQAFSSEQIIPDVERKLAVGASREAAEELNCDCILVDFPVTLIMESADIDSCIVMMGQHLLERKASSSFNVLVLECFENQMTTELGQFFKRKQLDVSMVDCIQLRTLKDKPKDVLIVKSSQAKSESMFVEKTEYNVINVVPFRTISEGLAMAKSYLYKSEMYLWTESISQAFNAWNQLPFSNVYVNNFGPLSDAAEIYLNGFSVVGVCLNNVAETCWLNCLPSPQNDYKTAIRLSLYSGSSKSTNLKNVVEELLPNYPGFSLNKLLSWNEMGKNFQILTRMEPISGFNIGCVLNNREDLAFVMLGLFIGSWNSAIIALPEDECIKSTFFSEERVKLDKHMWKDCTLVFSSDGKASAGVKTARVTGDLTAFSLLQCIMFECSLIKQIQIPFSSTVN